MLTNTNNRHATALRNRLTAAAAINLTDDSTVEFNGKSYPRNVVEAAALSAGLASGHLFVEGCEMLNPCVTVTGRRTGRRAVLSLTFDKRINAQGDIQSTSIKVTPARLAEIVQGFFPAKGYALGLDDRAQIAAKLAANTPLRASGSKAPNSPRCRSSVGRLSAGQRALALA